LRQERIVVSSEMLPTTPKTKDLVNKLSAVDAKRVLLVADELTEEMVLASRNIPYVEVSTVEGLTPVALVAADKVIATPSAVKKIEERLA